MRKLFRTAGARDAGRVVVYCRTGLQASFAYFVAKFLGLDVSLYDGSFQEWSNSKGLPVQKGRTLVVNGE